MTELENDSDAAVWDQFRRLMPCAERWAYFDHAAVAPLSLPAQLALTNWAKEFAEHGAVDWLQWAAELEHLRRRAADLLHADVSEIALVHNTTEGINLVAEGFPWQSGDNVVIFDDEFPSNVYPWMNLEPRGVELRRVPAGNRPSLDDLAKSCDKRTRVVSVSWVGFASGWRHDLDELAEIVHRRGALLFLDAIQGLGVFPLDVQATPIDFLAADGHKWLLGPEGAGLFYLRREHLDRLRPIGLGWNSVQHAHDFSKIELRLKASAGRYEGGTYNMPGLLALGASLEMLGDYPPEQLSQRIVALTDEIYRRLPQIGAVNASEREPEHASGILSFDLPGRNLADVRRQCRQRQVVLSCRGGRLRVSPHAYNNAEDIDRLFEALTAK
ncbi:MAG TPA: aminotransferase class V-fold PLP-dependent enzyme [Pirellulales bacterium]|nr:aminotransferase class V-fold PLP-dependent enzyme [Pirellulales bacterium]